MATLVTNKKAGFNYEILEKFEAGLELLGLEVKSLRRGHGSLDGSYVKTSEKGAFLVGALISPYQPNNTPKDYDPRRPRQLLLTKPELKRLLGAQTTQGLTVVPLSVYSKGRHLKLEIALARGKKKYDKRQTIKKREADREVRRTLKSY